MLLASGGMHTRESRVLASMHTLALARAENLQILLEYELVVCIEFFELDHFLYFRFDIRVTKSAKTTNLTNNY